MASSLEVYPASLPGALLQGQGFNSLPNGRQRERDQGEMRMRPRFRQPPESAAVVWIFNQPQFDAFHDWYEVDLVVGSARFDLPLHRRGSVRAITWYAARFVGDYQTQVMEGLRYQVSATLLLVEDLGPVRVTPGIEAIGAGVHFAGGVSFPASAVRVGGTGVRFAGGVSLLRPDLEISGVGVLAAGAALMPLPAIALAGAGIQFGGDAQGL